MTTSMHYKHDQHNQLEDAIQYARIRQILRDCRIAHMSDEELARVRLFYANAGLHPKAHVPLRSIPQPCDIDHVATPLHLTA